MTTSRWNIPNVLSATRLLGVPVLFVLVRRAPVTWFAVLYVLLGVTDYLDGRLARAWNQTTAFGSTLDAAADVAYYVSTAYFAVQLFPAYVVPNIPYVVGCLALYATLVLVSKVRVGHVLLPHTHLSRAAGVLVVLAMFVSFLKDTTWLFRSVIMLYGVAFIEQIAMVGHYGDIPLDTRSILWLRSGVRRPISMERHVGTGADGAAGETTTSI